MKLGIVAIGYNRIDSLERLLNSLNAAYYEENTMLIISLDNPGNTECLDYANGYGWNHGEKKVIFANERMGLRRHVIKCGNYLNDFDLDAIAVFEDDIWVSPYFYNYYRKSVEYYCDNDSIAGISLYAYDINPIAMRPFQPMDKGSDVYFHQYAPSWGQIWMKKQWNDFYDWYKLHENEWPVDCDEEIPGYVINWPNTSWLKYHIAYCVARHKYFVYPYKAFSTNYGDAGQHVTKKYNIYQVSTVDYKQDDYRFVDVNDDSAVVYDAFFENKKMDKYFEVETFGNMLMDIYGQKNKLDGYEYIVTSKKYNIAAEKSFGLELRPMEYNLIRDINGDSIFIYKISDIKNLKPVKYGIIERYKFDLRGEKLPIHYEMFDSINRLYRKFIK